MCDVLGLFHALQHFTAQCPEHLTVSPEAVLSDVIEHKVSIDKAEELYGVKIEKDGSSFRLA